jgi:hypothetical protein
MCYSFESSIYTFLFTVVVSLILYQSQIPIYQTNAFILLSFCFVQFSDAIIHYSINHNYPLLNYIFTKYVTNIILSLEIPLIYLAVYYLTKKRNLVFEAIITILIPIMLVKTISSCHQLTTRDSDGYLLWCGETIQSHFRYLFLIGLVFAVYHYPNTITKYIFVFIVILTFGLNYSSKSFGSRWCHHANLMALLFLLNYIYKMVI